MPTAAVPVSSRTSIVRRGRRARLDMTPPLRRRFGPTGSRGRLARLILRTLTPPVVGRLAPVAHQHRPATGTGQCRLRPRERLVMLRRGRLVFYTTSVTGQGAFAIGARDHGRPPFGAGPWVIG